MTYHSFEAEVRYPDKYVSVEVVDGIATIRKANELTPDELTKVVEYCNYHARRSRFTIKMFRRTLADAKAALSKCDCEVLKDRAFGDSEWEWTLNGTSIASGYFGNSGQSVTFSSGETFKDAEAYELRESHASIKTVYNE